MDIKLKSSYKDIIVKKNPKTIVIWIIRVIAIISAVLVILVNNDYKALKLIIIFLVYINVILAIKFLVNQFRSFALWKFIDESISEVENNKNSSIKKAANEFMGDGFEEVMGSAYGEVVENVKRILDVINKGVKNTETNEKMNIELVNNLTNKLDKPLNAILDNVESLSKSEDNEGESLEILTKQSGNLKVLIEELFEASKVASGDLQAPFHNIEIVALLKQSFIEFKDKIDNSNLTFRLNVPSEKININANGEKLWRVFEILIQNTLKHSLENSRVYIDVVNSLDNVSIKFRNTSKSELNIEPEDLVYVMNSNDEECASGLGLEIARNLVVLQNGKFNLEIDADLFKVEIIFNKCGE
ncbi:MAG: sensor histidine kinase [Clostridium sp.]